MNFLYPDLEPLDRFVKILELHVMHHSAQAGFKLIKSGSTLKKTYGDFEWLVEFDGRKFNRGNYICRFNPYFRITHSKYRKFLKQNPELVRGWGNRG